MTAARTELRNHLHSISGTARAAGAETPGLEDKFFLPGGRLSDQKLLAAGHAFLKDAEPLADAFIQHEMPADFLDKLKQHVGNLEQALEERAGSGELRDATRSNIEAMVEKGLAAIDRLDPIVRNKLYGDTVSLAVWDRALHVPHPSRQKAPPAPNPPAPAAEPQK